VREAHGTDLPGARTAAAGAGPAANRRAVRFAALPASGPAPLAGLTVRRTLGGHGTRFSAVLDDRVVGFFEVQGDLTAGGAQRVLDYAIVDGSRG